MRKTMTSLLAIGIGTAAYSLSGRQKKKGYVASFIQPISNSSYMNKKMWKRLGKKLMK